MKNKHKSSNYSFKEINKQNIKLMMKCYPVKRIAFHRKVGKKA